MSTISSSSSPEGRKPSTPTTRTYVFCDNSKVEKTATVRGHMEKLSPFQRAKLLSSESRVCIAYYYGKQLMVLMEDINADILYHFCPQLSGFYNYLKETGPTIVLPNTKQFDLVTALGVEWAIGSFVHEVSEGTRSFVKQYIRRHSDPRQLFYAAAAFRAFDLPRYADDLVRDDGAIVHYLNDTARKIESPKVLGKWVRSLEADPIIRQDDLALLGVAYEVLDKRTAGYGKKKKNSE